MQAQSAGLESFLCKTHKVPANTTPVTGWLPQKAARLAQSGNTHTDTEGAPSENPGSPRRTAENMGTSQSQAACNSYKWVQGSLGLCQGISQSQAVTGTRSSFWGHQWLWRAGTHTLPCKVTAVWHESKLSIWGIFLAVQWLRLHLPGQGVQVQSLLRELRSLSPPKKIIKKRIIRSNIVTNSYSNKDFLSQYWFSRYPQVQGSVRQ